MLGMMILLLLPLLAACGEEEEATESQTVAPLRSTIKIGIGYPLKIPTGINPMHMAEMAA